LIVDLLSNFTLENLAENSGELPDALIEKGKELVCLEVKVNLKIFN
jgi:hypothetical protein